MSITLLNAVDVDTDGAANGVTISPRLLAVWADDYGSGTVTFQVSPDSGSTWFTVTKGGVDMAYTANALVRLPDIGVGMMVRATLTGSTSPSNVSAVIYEAVY